MKILVAGHSSAVGGAEISMTKIVDDLLGSHLAREVILVLPRKGPVEQRIRNRSAQNLRTIYLRSNWWMSKKGYGAIGLARLLLSFFDVFSFLVMYLFIKPDLVIVISSVTPAPMIASKFLKIPSFLTLGESIQSNETLRSVLPKDRIRQIINWSTERVYVCSNYASKEYGFPSQVMYPHLDFDGNEMKKVRSSREFQFLKDGNLRMCLVGNVSKEKGHFLAVEVAAALQEKNFDFSLKLHGHGASSEVEELNALIRKLQLSKKVKFQGPIANSQEAFADADLALVLSGAEAFGKITVEALVSGLPVLGTNIGGTREILEVGGGMLVERKVSAIFNAVKEIIETPAKFTKLCEEIEMNPFVNQFPFNRNELATEIEKFFAERSETL